MVILLFNTSIFEPTVWAIPVVLSTLIILLEGKKSITLNNSVSDVFPEPTLRELPTDIVVGTAVTEISWTNPATLPAVIDTANPVDSVLTPTLNASVRFFISVLKPEIDTASWLFNSMNGR